MSRPTDILPVLEETLDIAKRTVSTGRVRVEIQTQLVEELARANLDSWDIDVTRVPVGRMVAAAPETQIVGDLTIIPILEEILVVEKRLFLKEELHVRRRLSNETVEMPVQLRKQTAVVTRIPQPDPTIQNED